MLKGTEEAPLIATGMVMLPALSSNVKDVLMNQTVTRATMMPELIN